MTKIVSAASTLAPAWLAIREKGYDVSISPNDKYCVARKEDDEFVAEDTVMLLGLISIYETRGENWEATDAEIDDFTTWDGSRTLGRN